ncbi:hypothetical protein FOCG_11667 [Fusarium oxysporum f. sp. radicis-lycopersici 26381]|nr:hypothetical protein FOCG_11667 [Fusarium oxysporum f. sp. radicis-lycopersici 26381]
MARPKKRKPTDEGQDDLIVKSEAEGQENALDAENKILRAEIKLLKDSVTDLRIALASKTELIEELRQITFGASPLECLQPSPWTSSAFDKVFVTNLTRLETMQKFADTSSNVHLALYSLNLDAYDAHSLDCLFALVDIYSQMLPGYFDKEKYTGTEENNAALALV